MFAMSLYMLYEATHVEMDRDRSRFFWEGVGEKRKYHMVDWATVCKPKEFGVLGILNTRNVNIALMPNGSGSCTKGQRVYGWTSLRPNTWGRGTSLRVRTPPRALNSGPPCKS
jgi:hypothetical protein